MIHIYFIFYIYAFIQFLRIIYCKLNYKNNIIILGLPRTGTTSTCYYLSKINNKVWHFTTNHKLIRLLGYNCIGDIPYFRRNFSNKNIEKNTKYILTVRNPHEWEKSIRKFAYDTWNIEKNKKQPFFSKTIKGYTIFHHSPFNTLNNFVHDFNKEFPEIHSNNLRKFMEEHIINIKNAFENNKDQLLIIDVTKNDKKIIKKKI